MVYNIVVKSSFLGWDCDVRLDSWHFIRRFADNCSSTHHPLLFKMFMGKLSNALFEYVEEDIEKLCNATRKKLISSQGFAPVNNEDLLAHEISPDLLQKCAQKKIRYIFFLFVIGFADILFIQIFVIFQEFIRKVIYRTYKYTVYCATFLNVSLSLYDLGLYN